jgi:cation-transporting ATPase E
MKLNGLSDAEVKERNDMGKRNFFKQKTTKSIPHIVLSNLFTYFNLIFTVLSVLLIAVGSYRSLTFLPVVIANIIIGIVQQIRSKLILDKLNLLDQTHYEVIRSGNRVQVDSESLVQDDLIVLESGQQIPADAVVMDGEVYVNESLLTGESDEVRRNENDELKSGSFIVSGRCHARLTKVGSESYASQLVLKAKFARERPAEMIRDIERIIKVTGILIIPIGILMVYQAIVLNGESVQTSIVSMVGAVIGMIPEGMYLLATIALAASAARLAGKKILLHDMKSIETLARVNVICVDKTGTITSSDMKVDQVFAPADTSSEKQKEMEGVLKSYVQTVPDSNDTMQAVRTWASSHDPLEAIEVLPFSSANKYSEIQTEDHTYRFGAPEYLLNEAELEDNRKLLERCQRNGERILAFTEDGKAALFISLINQIRETAPDTFAWFGERGVDVKVISGDHPMTVSNVARKAGIQNADRYVDATTLTSQDMIEDAVKRYTVFGRVKPEQKKEIVEALHKQNQKVAMTGDGVNDILAMKEADCSIAMGSGSDAARQAAQVVLLDSDFSHMKDIVWEGRRDVNNITRSATLFLYKNIFSFLLAVLSLIGEFTYPLSPSQVSLISMFNIGIPAFLLAMEDNQSRQENGFLKNTLLRAAPAALTSFFAIAFMVLFGDLFSIPDADISTASTYLLSVVGFMILWRITRPANWYHVAVFALCIIGIFICTTYFRFIFSLTDISIKSAALCVVFAIAEVTIMNWITRIFELVKAWKKKLKKQNAGSKPADLHA